MGNSLFLEMLILFFFFFTNPQWDVRSIATTVMFGRFLNEQMLIWLSFIRKIFAKKITYLDGALYSG
jgi:hypothetical protein